MKRNPNNQSAVSVIVEMDNLTKRCQKIVLQAKNVEDEGADPEERETKIPIATKLHQTTHVDS